MHPAGKHQLWTDVQNKLVGLGNFEIPTHWLKASCSSSELQSHIGPTPR